MNFGRMELVARMSKLSNTLNLFIIRSEVRASVPELFDVLAEGDLHHRIRLFVAG